MQNIYSEKVFKTIKLLANPFLVMFTKKSLKEKLALQGQSNGACALGLSKGNWELERSRLLGNWALRHSKGTWALRRSGTWTLEALEWLDLADSFLLYGWY